MNVRGIVALSVVAALAVVAVACGGADAEVKVDKGLAAYAGANPASVESDAGQSARPAASTNTGSEVSYGEQLGAPAARSAVAPSGMGGDTTDSAIGSAYPKTTDSARLAPMEQAGPLGIVVQGYGRATAPADTAKVGFVVGKGGVVYPEPMGITKPMEPGVVTEDSGAGSAPSQPVEVTPVPPDVYPTPVPVTPITDADLQPLIDAIKAQGVSDGDIEVNIYPSTYYGPYGTPTARVTVTLHDMSKVGGLIDAGNQAVNNSNTIYMQNVGVTYSVNDCDVLLREARAAAVQDARDNGAGLADALGVGLGGIQGATESNWDPYGYSGCQSQSGGPVPYEYEGPPYDPSVAAEVQIISNVTISFAMQ
jgi:uncharacterized protein YggE